MQGFDEALWELLRCPRTGGRLQRVSGWPWADRRRPEGVEGVESFLLTEDGEWAYPIRGGIVELLPESAVSRRDLEEAGGSRS